MYYADSPRPLKIMDGRVESAAYDKQVDVAIREYEFILEHTGFLFEEDDGDIQAEERRNTWNRMKAFLLEYKTKLEIIHRASMKQHPKYKEIVTQVANDPNNEDCEDWWWSLGHYWGRVVGSWMAEYQDWNMAAVMAEHEAEDWGDEEILEAYDKYLDLFPFEPPFTDEVFVTFESALKSYGGWLVAQEVISIRSGETEPGQLKEIEEEFEGISGEFHWFLPQVRTSGFRNVLKQVKKSGRP